MRTSEHEDTQIGGDREEPHAAIGGKRFEEIIMVVTFKSAGGDKIMVASWPEFDSSRKDGDIEEQFTRFQSVLGALREIRSSPNIAPKKQVEFSVRCDEPTAEMLRALEPYFRRLANATAVGWGDKVEPPATVRRAALEARTRMRAAGPAR